MQEFEFVKHRSGIWFIGLVLIVAGMLAALIASGVAQHPGAPDLRLRKIGAMSPQAAAPPLPRQASQAHPAHP